MTTSSALRLRREVYAALMRAKVAAYPYPPHGHHPNFKGAAQAAERLLAQLWARTWLAPGQTVLCYPDYVLSPLRRRLLQAGVDVVVPAQYRSGYRLLVAGRVDPRRAASIAGAERLGVPLSEPPACALVALAGVVFDRRGRVLSKGYGFRTPAALAALPAVALCHELQLVERLELWDAEVQLLATPTDVYRLVK